MDYQYLGGGQESGRSSVGQALDQVYSPLESMQKMSQEFVQQGLQNAGANYRASMEVNARSMEAQQARNDERRRASEEKRALRKQQLGYLGELLAEQEALVLAAEESGDPDQERRVPEVKANIARIRQMLTAPADFNTLEGMLKRNNDRASLEFESVGDRGALRAPKGQKSEGPAVKTGDGKQGKKDDGKRTVASSRKPISLD